MHFNKRLWLQIQALSVAFLLSSQSYAYTGQHNKQSIAFDVKPKSCLLKEPQKPCIRKITFFWQTSTNTPVCVRTTHNKILFCQKNGQQNTKVLDFKISRSTQFELIHSLSKKVLAKTQLMVVTELEANRRSRYRHSWSIF